MRRSALAVLLALTALGGCQDASRNGPPPLVEVAPDEVTAEALRAAVRDPAVRRFYEARQWRPAWTEEAGRALTAALAQAPSHALDRRLFWQELPAEASAAEREAALTLAALGYADALADGVVDPRSVWEVYTVPMNRVDLSQGLNRALEENGLARFYSGLAPTDPEYQALSRAFAEMRGRAARERPLAIPAGETIDPGGRDARVPAIAESLRRSGHLPAAAPAEEQASPPDPRIYTPELAQAVARLQEDQGIEPDGIVGAETIEALNVSTADRARMLAVNLERRRWLQRRPPATRIDVNTAGTFLDYWRDGARAHRARVVVGQPEWETPQLGSPMTRLVANPPWTVPESIAEAEILPKGGGYMARNNMRFVNGRIVQAPGPESALGLVKFDLDNPHAIYLHDTPAKALFAEAERHASHGCARVHDALAFARLIADHQGKRETFERALASGEERGVELAAPIPVRFLYHTVFLDGGRLVFRHDDYGWDDRVAAALRLQAQRRASTRRYATDVGP
jgi:L,D-transpeptidase YcbB